jgi:hypothetical protein
VSLRGGFDLLHIGTKRKIQTKTKKKPMNNCKSKMWAKRLTFHFHGFFLTSLVLKKKFVNVQLLQVRKTGNTRNATNYNNGKTKCQDFEIVVKTLALQKKKTKQSFLFSLVFAGSSKISPRDANRTKKANVFVFVLRSYASVAT